MLTDRLKKLFSSLKETEINKAVARSPFLNDPDGSKARQLFIDETTKLISTEIERLCSSYNPSALLDEFVDIITSTSFPSKIIRAGQTFYRARIGRKEIQGAVDDCNTSFILPYHGKDIGKPPALRTTGGRFNRAGQSFLYLSSDVETAIAEVHLQVGQECSVGEFECIRDVYLVDLSDEGFKTSFKDDYIEATARAATEKATVGATTEEAAEVEVAVEATEATEGRAKETTEVAVGATGRAVGAATEATGTVGTVGAAATKETGAKEYAAAIAEEKEIVKFWRDFLLQPVYSETRYKYLLTQFITDVFLKAGVQGLYFNSAQAKGDNIVWFSTATSTASTATATTVPIDNDDNDGDKGKGNDNGDKCNDSGEEQDAFELVKFSERVWRAEKIEYKISPVEDAVRKWCRSPDYRSISGLNDDEEEKKEAEIDYLVDWIEHEREERGVVKEKTQLGDNHVC